MAEKYFDKPYGHTLARLGGVYPNLCVVDADLQRATETDFFQSLYPGRYFDVGIAEANMVGISVGLALSGKTVFCGTFASFISQRVADQVFVSVAYCRANVKLIGVEPGLASGRNGASHQSLTDLAIMRAIPGMSVFDPGDATETVAIMEYLAKSTSPAYLRVPRGKTPVLLDPHGLNFQPGTSTELVRGFDVTIISAGIMLERCMQAAESLLRRGVSVRLISMPSIKPLDEGAIIRAALETGCILTAENHNTIGGLGAAVCEVVTAHYPVPVVRIGITDKFGEVGPPEWLAEKFDMSSECIAEGANRAIQLKEKLNHKRLNDEKIYNP